MTRPKRSQAPPAPEPIPFGPPVSRREWLAIAGILLLAAALRFAYPGRMAIEHFDEGVYASNIFFGPEEGNRYPYRHLYAPPLLPWLIEWLIVFLGPSGIAPFLPALLLGTATVPLAWWAARCWFGPASGFAAAALVATSDFHLLYSRTALSDVPVAFFILLAVYLYWEAVRRNSVAWSLAAGVATGLAWWTKYTGWLPLAIAAAGSLPWALLERPAAGASPRARLIAVAKCFAAMAVTASLVWFPVLWDLQPYGGYDAVADNHRGYLRPLSQWGANLWEQAGNLAAQSGVLTTIALSAFTATVPLMTSWPRAVRISFALWSAATAGLATFFTGPALPLAVIGLAALAMELIPRRALSAAPEIEVGDPLRRLAAWLVLAWFVGMLVTTPLYHPYARLAMPWLASAWFAASLCLARETPEIEIGAHSFDRVVVFAVVMLMLPATSLVANLHPEPWRTAGWTAPGWEDRTLQRRAAERFAGTIRFDHREVDQPAIVFVYGKPAAFYYLAAALASEGVASIPVGDLSAVRNPPDEIDSYLVTKPITVTMAPMQSLKADLHQIDLFTISWGAGSSLVRLDEGGRGPSTNWSWTSNPSLALYRLGKPPR